MLTHLAQIRVTDNCLSKWPEQAIRLWAVCPQCSGAISPSPRTHFLQRPQNSPVLACTRQEPPAVRLLGAAPPRHPLIPISPHQGPRALSPAPATSTSPQLLNRPAQPCHCHPLHLGSPALLLLPLTSRLSPMSPPQRGSASQLKLPVPVLLLATALTAFGQIYSLLSCPFPSQPGAPGVGPMVSSQQLCPHLMLTGVCCQNMNDDPYISHFHVLHFSPTPPKLTAATWGCGGVGGGARSPWRMH